MSSQQRWDEPSPDERERALGYSTGATTAPGLTLRDRHVVTGRCMDALLAIPIALQHRKGTVLAALAAVSLLEQPTVGVMAPPPPLPVPTHTISVPDHDCEFCRLEYIAASWLAARAGPRQGSAKDDPNQCACVLGQMAAAGLGWATRRSLGSWLGPPCFLAWWQQHT